MLYTVRPLERIYASPGLFDSKKSKNEHFVASNEAEYKEVLLPNGRVVTRRDGENYVVERVNSTDMLDYLKDEYAPGKSVK